MGKVLLQFADGLPGDLSRHAASNSYYREGGEWYYHADLWVGDDGDGHPMMYVHSNMPPVHQDTRDGVAVGNADVAGGTRWP